MVSGLEQKLSMARLTSEPASGLSEGTFEGLAQEMESSVKFVVRIYISGIDIGLEWMFSFASIQSRPLKHLHNHDSRAMH